MDVPQLWELGEESDPVLAEALELARAHEADVGLADRMRGWVGAPADIHILGGHVRHGVVGEVFRDAVVLNADTTDVLIPVAAVLSARGPRRGAVAPRGRQRASGLTVLRDVTGSAVRIDLVDGGRRSGRLVAVGSDHVAVAVPAGEELVPWPAVTAAEWRTPV